ncbi:MAG: hypothetical protein ACLFR2_07705 [Candidatus Kapaibacterium sp.]
MRDLITEKICDYCGKPYTAKRGTSKYCSNACRTKAYRNRKNIPEPDFKSKSPSITASENELRLKLLLSDLKNFSNKEKDLENNFSSVEKKFRQSLKTYENSPTPWTREYYFRRQKEYDEVKNDLFFCRKQKKAILEKIQSTERDILKEKSFHADLIVNSDELLKMHFPILRLKGEWENFMGSLKRNFTLFISGPERSGKTIFCLRFADMLKDFGKVVYFALSDTIGLALQKKVRDFGISNIDICKAHNYKEFELVVNQGGYDFFVIDQIDISGISAGDFLRIRKNHPDIALTVSLKEGYLDDFLNPDELDHFETLIIKASAGKAYLNSEGKTKKFNIFL